MSFWFSDENIYEGMNTGFEDRIDGVLCKIHATIFSQDGCR